MQYILLLFALLIAISSWQLWRRSPLYSVKITLKLACAVLLIVLAIVGITLALIRWAGNLSPEAETIAALVGVLIVSTAATGLIIRITDAHVAQLPPSVQLVTIHQRKVQRWIWRILIYEAANAIVALLLPAAWKWLPLFLGGFILLLCGPMVMGFYMRARRLDLGMSEVVAKPWIHWQYTSAEWESWTKSQLAWERSKAGQLTVGASVKLFLFCVVLFAVGALFTGESFRENIIIVAGLSVFILILLLIAYWFGRTNFERRHRRLLEAPAETYFGDEGLFCNGEYAAWILSGSFLMEATAASDPPARVILIFQTYSGSTAINEARRILVPESHWSDVELLQQKLHARCPKAFIHMSKPAG